MLNIVYTGETNRQTPKLPQDEIKSHSLPNLCHAKRLGYNTANTFFFYIR